MDIVAKAFYAPIEEIEKEVVVNNLDEDELRWTFLKRKLPGFVELHNFNRWYFGKASDMPDEYQSEMDKNAVIITQLMATNDITEEEFIQFFSHHPGPIDILNRVLSRVGRYNNYFKASLFEALYLKLSQEDRKSAFDHYVKTEDKNPLRMGFAKRAVQEDNEEIFDYVNRDDLKLNNEDFEFVWYIAKGCAITKSTKYLERILREKLNLYEGFFRFFCEIFDTQAHAMYIRAIVKLGGPDLLFLFNYVNTNPNYSLKITNYQALYLAGLDYSIMRVLKNPLPGLQEFLHDNESDI
jgi:hypothetical protein